MTFHGANGKDSFSPGTATRDNVRLAVGQITSGIYGMAGFDGSGNTLLELSETQALIGGWTISGAGLSSPDTNIVVGTTGGNQWGISIDDAEDQTNHWWLDDDNNQVQFYVGSDTSYVRYDSAATPTLDIKVQSAVISGSSVQIKTPDFFLGQIGSQFVSGSGGNIEISSSMFHLDPETSTMTLSGSITATAGTIGGWEIGHNIISSSTSADTDGIILDPEAKVLTFHGATGLDSFSPGTATRDNVRLAVGQISSGIYGMSGYDGSGNTVWAKPHILYSSEVQPFGILTWRYFSSRMVNIGGAINIGDLTMSGSWSVNGDGHLVLSGTQCFMGHTYFGDSYIQCEL